MVRVGTAEVVRVGTAEVVRGIARPGSCRTHNDMEKAFYHMANSEEAKQYFGFTTLDGRGIIYYFAFEGLQEKKNRSSIHPRPG